VNSKQQMASAYAFTTDCIVDRAKFYLVSLLLSASAFLLFSQKQLNLLLLLRLMSDFN